MPLREEDFICPVSIKLSKKDGFSTIGHLQTFQINSMCEALDYDLNFQANSFPSEKTYTDRGLREVKIEANFDSSEFLQFALFDPSESHSAELVYHNKNKIVFDSLLIKEVEIRHVLDDIVSCWIVFVARNFTIESRANQKKINETKKPVKRAKTMEETEPKIWIGRRLNI